MTYEEQKTWMQAEQIKMDAQNAYYDAHVLPGILAEQARKTADLEAFINANIDRPCSDAE